MTGLLNPGNYVSACGSLSLYGGFNICGSKCVISKSISIADSFWKISITTTMYLIDSWDLYENEGLQIFLDTIKIRYIQQPYRN